MIFRAGLPFATSQHTRTQQLIPAASLRNPAADMMSITNVELRSGRARMHRGLASIFEPSLRT
jgi:hypothetical protein